MSYDSYDLTQYSSSLPIMEFVLDGDEMKLICDDGSNDDEYTLDSVFRHVYVDGDDLKIESDPAVSADPEATSAEMLATGYAMETFPLNTDYNNHFHLVCKYKRVALKLNESNDTDFELEETEFYGVIGTDDFRYDTVKQKQDHIFNLEDQGSNLKFNFYDGELRIYFLKVPSTVGANMLQNKLHQILTLRRAIGI